MTIVGDVAQTGDPAGSASWGDALGPHVGDRWRLAPLTVNYRTPAEIMAVAAEVLAEIDPAARPPRSVRESGAVPWRLGVAESDGIAAVVAQAAAEVAAQTGDGTLAVIVPAGRLAEVGASVAAILPDAGVGSSGDVAIGEPGGQAGAGQPGGQAGAGKPGREPGGAPGAGEPDLERPVVVLTVRQAKGLEFDSVVVADPAMILAESPRGLGDLYVALTRATQRAGVVYSGDLPAVLNGLSGISSIAGIRSAAGTSDAASEAPAEVA
jgi:hypothetical protein